VTKSSKRLGLVTGSGGRRPTAFAPEGTTFEFTSPVVSPDGNFFLASAVGSSSRAFVGRLDAMADARQISPDDETWECMSWSIDSKAIVVTRRTEPGPWMQSQYEVATGALTNLLPGEYKAGDAPCGHYLNDFTLLVTSRSRTNGSAMIFSQRIGSEARTEFLAIPDCNVIYPQQRPGTREVAVIAGCENVYDDGLWLTADDGSPPRHVLTGYVAAPTWSPDGTWILFGWAPSRRVAPELWIAMADGSAAKKVADAWTSWPTWIPATSPCSVCRG
jgi:Tol biopolymer transport system component